MMQLSFSSRSTVPAPTVVGRSPIRAFAASSLVTPIVAFLAALATTAHAQVPIAIESPPKPEVAMKMVYGGNTWRDERAAAFFGGPRRRLRAEVREVFRARYVEADVDKLMLVYQLTPGPHAQFQCHACIPALGAAVLAADAQGRWRLRARGLLLIRDRRSRATRTCRCCSSPTIAGCCAAASPTCTAASRTGRSAWSSSATASCSSRPSRLRIQAGTGRLRLRRRAAELGGERAEPRAGAAHRGRAALQRGQMPVAASRGSAHPHGTARRPLPAVAQSRDRAGRRPRCGERRRGHPPARSADLVGLQVDAGLGRADALDQPHALQDLGELAQMARAQLRQQVPAAVGVEQPGHTGLAQQDADDLAGPLPSTAMLIHAVMCGCATSARSRTV
ncbi:hypothetical protein Ddc_23907 [Ditylenchus destructor]|nr:hypothetical protein Ddc_23907 [Ditylenchus destructor]